MNDNTVSDAAIIIRSRRRRHHNYYLLACCVLAVISASQSSPLSSSSKKSTTGIISVVSAELRPRALGFHPSSLAFLPHESCLQYDKKRRRSHHHRITTPSHSLFSTLLFNLRCGGTDESKVDEGEEIAEYNNKDTSETSPQQQPVVDISVVENVDSSADTIEVDGPGFDSMTHAQNVDVDAESNDNKDSDLTESAAKVDELGTTSSGDDVLSTNNDDTDEGSDINSSVESSEETDIPTDEMSPLNLAIPSDAIEIDSDETSDTENQSQLLRSFASDKRAEGKTLHDAGSLTDAAQAFHEAASLLDEVMAASGSSSEDLDDINSIAVERATCRLHEALCLLKDGRPGDCIEACTDVLEDGVTVVPLETEDGDNGEGGDVDSDNADGSKPTAVVKIIPPPPPSASSTSSHSSTIPPQIRARAHHRRAKARLALGDLDGALEDARSAAFMGDRNAVQFYGRLMREGSGAAASSGESLLPVGGLGGTSPFGTSDGSNQFLESMMKGLGGNNNHPLMPSGAGSSDFSSSLLSSLLTSGAGDGSSGSGNPFGLMGDLLSPQTTKEGKSGKRRRGRKKKQDSLAKSVLSSLMKKIENEETQEQICSYLQSTNTQQIMSFATMAGVPVKEESARRLVTLAKGVTPERISKSISRVKRGVSIFKTGRKILKVIDKYKAVIVLGVLCYWIRSAMTQPYPVSKKQKEAAKELAQKAALSLLIMPSSITSRCQNGSLAGLMRALGTSLSSSGSDESIEGVDDGNSASQTGIEEELEQLQNQLLLIEALEERNKAQLESFVDAEDQCQSLEQEERDLLSSKDAITQRTEVLTEQLVMLFMGQKMREG